MAEKRYTGEAIDVTYSLKRCIHAAECVRGLPVVFDTENRPWIQPDQALADEIVAVVLRCPSGALHFERKDGGPPETAPAHNTVELQANGPLYVRGTLELLLPDGTPFALGTRFALCRCGASANKPFCDNAHRRIGFVAPDPTTKGAGNQTQMPATGGLTITPSLNGPLRLRGEFEIRTGSGTVLLRGSRVALCRCGGSANKPFCDGTHGRIGFTSEAEQTK